MLDSATCARVAPGTGLPEEPPRQEETRGLRAVAGADRAGFGVGRDRGPGPKPGGCAPDRAWIAYRPLTSTAPIFVNQRGERLGRDGVAYLLQKYVEKAGARISSLGRKRVHPHSIRHTTAVHMRRAGDEPNAIAALLGHAQITTTERFYGHVDLEEKRKAIEANPPPVKKTAARWRRPEVLEFLEGL